MGTINIPLANAVGTDVMVVEYGIGYNGTFAKYRVFESYAHMHKIWGAEGGFNPDGRFYDTVIPNYLNPADYPSGVRRQGRLLPLPRPADPAEGHPHRGRDLQAAGSQAEDRRAGMRQGGRQPYLSVRTARSTKATTWSTSASPRAEAGTALPDAIATFVPTTYIEPFGAVAIEISDGGHAGHHD